MHVIHIVSYKKIKSLCKNLPFIFFASLENKWLKSYNCFSGLTNDSRIPCCIFYSYGSNLRSTKNSVENNASVASGLFGAIAEHPAHFERHKFLAPGVPQ